MRYAQEHGTGVLVVDKFANETHVNSAGVEYSLATYLLGNEGGMLLFTGGLNDYGTMQYHAEYGAAIGRPCSHAASSGSIFSRRFSGGMAVVNASGSTQRFTLPSSGYRDIEGRGVSGTALTLGPNDAYVLLGGSGC